MNEQNEPWDSTVFHWHESNIDALHGKKPDNHQLALKFEKIFD